jgi:hypothetical protein
MEADRGIHDAIVAGFVEGTGAPLVTALLAEHAGCVMDDTPGRTWTDLGCECATSSRTIQ